MKRRLVLQLLGCMIFTALVLGAAPPVIQAKLNVVVILADNVGYGDLGNSRITAADLRPYQERALLRD
jgi:hypothetical protein